jgi:uncharacterized repeat protein (TIGR03803 family)
MKRIINAVGKLNWSKRAYTVFVLCATTLMVLPAQTFTTLHSFDGTDGLEPQALVLATDGNLYGTTFDGGANASGTVFKITASGSLTTLYNFCSLSQCADGRNAVGVVQGTDGNFYGTTYTGGVGGGGTVFRITPGGTLTTLHSFCSQSGCLGGHDPVLGLIQATNGDFYGTTSLGGDNDCFNGLCCGTVFRITPAGKLKTVYILRSQGKCTSLQSPFLMQAASGDFYGTRYPGGAHNRGTLFRMTPSGTLTTLYSFCSLTACLDGSAPYGGLVQATNGDFYGVTKLAGANHQGTVFRMTPSGTLKTLYNFCPQTGCPDGSSANALVQATDGNFYGTTYAGGAGGEGTVFRITPGGTLTTLYSFCSQTGCRDGASVETPIVQDTNGTFYGTAAFGGAHNDGTVFSLSVGLGPFVETQPTSGKVGAVVKILGTDLTGASSVSFNGAAAVFEVVSSSEIMATVPADATNGKVNVVTPGRTLSSNVPFRVQP